MDSEDNSPFLPPSTEDYQKYADQITAIADLHKAAAGDFTQACQEALAHPSAYAWRNVIRCFGSLIESIAAGMREVAVGLCSLHGKELNRFLQEKSQERSTSTQHRIYTNYRLIAEFLPASPLAHLEDARWEDLRHALTIRNRVMHPASIDDLKLAEVELSTVISTATAFTRDMDTFCEWFTQEFRKMSGSTKTPLKRLIPKIGRNDPCPCGSNRKFKSCCGAA